MSLRRATEADLGFIMDCERRPGYEPFVGSWEAPQHRATMEDPDWCYLIGSRDGVDGGFVILSGMNHRNRCLLLKRIASRDAGQGFGKAFLAEVTDWVFAETNTHRFWLEVVEDNPRARHVYTSLGWKEEGVEREAFDRRDGPGRGNFVLMAMLKPEWRR